MLGFLDVSETGSHRAPFGVPFRGSSESPSSSAVTSVYSAAAWLTGVPGCSDTIAGDRPLNASAASLSTGWSGGNGDAAFAAGERCIGDRPGDGVAAHMYLSLNKRSSMIIICTGHDLGAKCRQG